MRSHAPSPAPVFLKQMAVVMYMKQCKGYGVSCDAETFMSPSLYRRHQSQITYKAKLN